MFQDVLFVPERNAGLRAVVLPLAALAHGLLALLLVTIPIMRPGDVPRVDLTSVFVAPAPPTPPPPPPKARGHAGTAGRRIKPVAAVGLGASAILTAPVVIPDAITEEPLDQGGAEYGIPGGVDYGAAGGYPKNLVGDALYRIIGDEAAPIRAAGEVRMPRLVKRVEPAYPEIARQAHIQGTVILEATTDTYGRVAGVKVLRSVPLLDEAAVDAVRQWLYEPMVVNGRPRGVVFTVTLRFELK
ncbi:MAG: energy transducer TonB [Candidatus Aminicenantales bacterium]